MFLTGLALKERMEIITGRSIKFVRVVKKAELDIKIQIIYND